MLTKAPNQFSAKIAGTFFKRSSRYGKPEEIEARSKWVHFFEDSFLIIKGKTERNTQ
jgi:hypothetical protein